MELKEELNGNTPSRHTKDLFLPMAWEEAKKYINDHPKWRMPTSLEAVDMKSEHGHCWVSDIDHKEDENHRHMCINMENGKVFTSHSNFMQPVALIDSGKRVIQKIEIPISECDVRLFDDFVMGEVEEFNWVFPNQFGEDIELMFVHEAGEEEDE